MFSVSRLTKNPFHSASRSSFAKYNNASLTIPRRFAGTTKYTKDHEWVKVEGNIGTVGITPFAASALGDVVYVDLPQVGASFKQKATLAAVESVKAASDIYAPISGTVKEVNVKLTSDPSVINKSPFGDGWMVKMDIKDQKELQSLLDEKAYKKHCDETGDKH